MTRLDIEEIAERWSSYPGDRSVCGEFTHRALNRCAEAHAHASSDIAALIVEVRELRILLDASIASPGRALYDAAMNARDQALNERDEVKAKLNDTIEQWDRANAIRRRQEETIVRMRVFVQQALDRANRFLEADSPIPFEALDDIAADLRIALKEPNDA